MIRCDDVFVDVDVNQFEKICQIVRRYDFDHLIGVTPKGEGKELWKPHLFWKMHFVIDFGFFVNYRIKRMCGEQFIGDNTGLIRLLNTEFSKYGAILALHGLHHYKYSNLSKNKVREELSAGVQLLKNLFGEKVEVFIPPFNVWNHRIELICKGLNLSVDKCTVGFDTLIRDMNDSQIIELAKWQCCSPQVFYHPQALTSLEKFELYLKTRRKYC
jgi:peptidoglycan/xylan/chitin deacetylase (PgdA/CDA1 family)